MILRNVVNLSLCLHILLFTRSCDSQFTHSTGWGGAGNGKRSIGVRLLDDAWKGAGTGQRSTGQHWQAAENSDPLDPDDPAGMQFRKGLLDRPDVNNNNLLPSISCLQQLFKTLKQVGQ